MVAQVHKAHRDNEANKVPLVHKDHRARGERLDKEVNLVRKDLKARGEKQDYPDNQERLGNEDNQVIQEPPVKLVHEVNPDHRDKQD